MDNNLKKVALYIRVSTTYQVDKDSLPMQRDDLINYAKYALGIERYELFEDAGYSAKSTERPAYQQMMSRLRDREFSHLLVWKIDRISRNLIDFSEMYNELKKLGVTFVSKNEQFQTDTPMGEAMLKIILVFAELERKMTSERVSSVMLSRATKGMWNGGKIPYGYDYNKDSKEITVNSVESSVVKRIYDMYEVCPSLLAIARELNSEGMTTRTGKPWNPVSISKILHNVFYTGVYQYNKLCESNGSNKSPAYEREQEKWIICENHHPAIIEGDRQSRILEKMASQRRGGVAMDNKSYVRKNVHIFSGLIECGICGSIYQSTSDKMRSNGYVPSVYHCSRRRRYSDCDNVSVTDANIGPFVLTYISNMIKIQNSFGKTTTADMLESKLLRGEALSGVTGIEHQGLVEFYELLAQRVEGVPYKPAFIESKDTKKPAPEEKDLLLSDKRKAERALQRLQQLYLYSDEDKAISDREYAIQKGEIQANLDRIKNRLLIIEQKQITDSVSDEDFMKRVTYFIMANKLNDRRYVNYSKFIQSTDKSVIKDFVQNAISKIVVIDSKIVSLRFVNGIEHKFLYG